MFVFMQDAAETVVPADVQTRDLAPIGDRFGLRVKWSGIRDASVRSMRVVVVLVLTQRVRCVSRFLRQDVQGFID